MQDDDNDIVPPERVSGSGAFVVRLWRVDRGLRARVRASRDLADPDAVDVSDMGGPPDAVSAEVGSALRQWLADFTGDTSSPA